MLNVKVNTQYLVLFGRSLIYPCHLHQFLPQTEPTLPCLTSNYQHKEGEVTCINHIINWVLIFCKLLLKGLVLASLYCEWDGIINEHLSREQLACHEGDKTNKLMTNCLAALSATHPYLKQKKLHIR